MRTITLETLAWAILIAWAVYRIGEWNAARNRDKAARRP